MRNKRHGGCMAVEVIVRKTPSVTVCANNNIDEDKDLQSWQKMWRPGRSVLFGYFGTRSVCTLAVQNLQSLRAMTHDGTRSGSGHAASAGQLHDDETVTSYRVYMQKPLLNTHDC
eukprot:scaffold96972_cov15-Tisochrysis_lutea.AAC.1